MTTPWFESLADSVYALGAAAREAQRAYRAAEIAQQHYDLDRLRPIDGEVALDDRVPSTIPFRPHDDALFRIGNTLQEQTNALRRLYAQTADAYAYGTTWAILRVLDGHQPATVSLGRTSEGYSIIPGELCPVPLMPRLERWNNYPKFVHARAQMLRCEEAGNYADYLDEQPHLSDHQAGEFHDALDTASNLPDAAYAYGVLAESALRVAWNLTRNQPTPATPES
jgi:hypothetical protein